MYSMCQQHRADMLHMVLVVGCQCYDWKKTSIFLENMSDGPESVYPFGKSMFSIFRYCYELYLGVAINYI